MKFRNLAAAAAALSLTAMPVAAQAAPQRSAAPVEEGSEVGGSAWFLAIIAAILIALGIYFAVDNKNDPVSP